MPFEPLDTPTVFSRIDAPRPPATPDEEAAAASVRPDLSATIAASFRTQNTIASAFAKEDMPDPSRVEDGFSSFDFVKGTPFEGDEDFIDVFNKRAAETMMRQKEREREDRRTVAASGWVGVAADIASGTLDWPSLLPGGAIVKGVKGGYAIGTAALSVGASAAAAAAIQEGALHASQYERTKTESGFAIGASALLGGFLGGGAAALLTRSERQAAERAVGELTGAPVRATSSPFGASGGAAAVSEVGAGDLDIAGRAASKVAEATAQLNPNLRLNTSPSKAARLYGQQLAENSLYQTGNDLGITAGPAVERLASNTFHARIYQAEKALDEAYKEMRKSGVSMTRRDFEEAVGMAARRNDEGANTYITQAAKAYRSTILDPFKNEAVSAKLLPEDVKTETSDSYLHRMWDFQKLTAGESDFKGIVRGWAKGLASSEAERLQGAAGRRMARIDQEIAEIRMTPEERRLNLWHIDAALERGNLPPAEANALQQARRRLRFNIAGSQDEIARLNQRVVETDEANIGRLRRMSAGIGRLEKGIERLDPDVLAKEVAGLNSEFNEILERSNRAASRVTRFLDRADADKLEIGDRLLREEGAEANRVAELDRIAARLDDLDSANPEEAIADLRRLIDDRLRQTLDRVSRANEAVARTKERIEALDPARLEKRIQELEGRRKNIKMDLNERLNIKLDAANGFDDYAREIADLVYDKLTGRQTDGATQGLGITLGPRGPLKERTFNIPDSLVEGFLNNNIVEVGRRYSRLMSGDVELTKRFGSVDMKEPKAKIADEYRALREQVHGAADLDEIKRITGKGFALESGMRKVGGGRPDERVKELALNYLAKREKADLRDLDGLRDLIRGTYGVHNADGAWNRITRAAGQFNYLRLMGGSVVASIGDIYRPAMVHGLLPFMRDGIAPLLTRAGREAAKLSREDAKRFGLVVERYTQGRLATFAEIGDPYRHGTAVERLLENSTKIANRWNGILIWTDAMKGISSVMSQDRIARGVLGQADDRFLAYLGIDRSMKARIAQQMTDHGEELDGVWVAHVADWTDAEAVRTYGAALGKDVDSIIVTKSVGDTPLFANTPTGRLLVQFKSFALASHQKVLLRGLQESPARFASGMVGMTALGVMAAYARAWRGGKDRFEKFKAAAENPGYLLGEGLDLAGIFAVPMEAANMGEKIFHTNVVKDPLKAAFPNASQQGSSLRYQSRGVASTFLGPTAGLIDLASEIAGVTALAAAGEATDKQKARAAAQAIQLVPYYSYPGMREMVNLLHGDR